MIDYLKQIDEKLLLFINGNHSAFFDFIFFQLSQSWHIVLIGLGIVFYYYSKSNLKQAVKILLALILLIGLSDFVSNTTKYTVKRYRPSHNVNLQNKIQSINQYKGGKFGFYSGHASNSMALVVFLGWLIFLQKKIWRLCLIAYALLIAYSRMYLGVHYPSDILIGLLMGTLFAQLFIKLCNKFEIKPI